MILLNYAHPLTDAQRDQLAALLGEAPAVREIAAEVDRALPLAQVAAALADAVGLAPGDTQAS